MPNRILKESLCTSETIAQLTDFEYRVWTGLILIADDLGRGDARAAVIKGRVFPLRDSVTSSKVENGLRGLTKKGCINIFYSGNKPTFEISGWYDMYPEYGRKTLEYKEWRKAVFERDNYTCRMCGKRGGHLNAHHIKRYRSNVSERTNIDNGITLCEECHKEVHHKEGK